MSEHQPEHFPAFEKENVFTPIELVWKYLSWLPLFIIALLIAIGAATLYVRYLTPIYKVSTRLLVKSVKDNPIGGSSQGGGGGDLIESALFSSRSVNIENEIVLLTRGPLLQQVVKDYGFNNYYYNVGNIRTSETFSPPFQILTDSTVSQDRSFGFYLRKIGRAHV